MATTDPNLVFNLRAKLDAAGHYDDFEVDRVVAVELNPNAKQSELVAALEPVQDRIMKRYKAALAHQREAAASSRHREAAGRGDPSADLKATQVAGLVQGRHGHLSAAVHLSVANLRLLLGKVMQSATLQQQAANNTKEQFADSTDLTNELQNAIPDTGGNVAVRST